MGRRHTLNGGEVLMILPYLSSYSNFFLSLAISVRYRLFDLSTNVAYVFDIIAMIRLSIMILVTSRNSRRYSLPTAGLTTFRLSYNEKFNPPSETVNKYYAAVEIFLYSFSS